MRSGVTHNFLFNKDRAGRRCSRDVRGSLLHRRLIIAGELSTWQNPARPEVRSTAAILIKSRRLIKT